MIVVRQNDPSARPDRPYHSAHDRNGIGNMLEQKPRMGKIEGAPLVIAQREIESVTGAELDKIRFIVGTSLTLRLGELPCVALDA